MTFMQWARKVRTQREAAHEKNLYDRLQALQAQHEVVLNTYSDTDKVRGLNPDERARLDYENNVAATKVTKAQLKHAEYQATRSKREERRHLRRVKRARMFRSIKEAWQHLWSDARAFVTESLEAIRAKVKLVRAGGGKLRGVRAAGVAVSGYIIMGVGVLFVGVQVVLGGALQTLGSGGAWILSHISDDLGALWSSVFEGVSTVVGVVLNVLLLLATIVLSGVVAILVLVALLIAWPIVSIANILGRKRVDAPVTPGVGTQSATAAPSTQFVPPPTPAGATAATA